MKIVLGEERKTKTDLLLHGINAPVSVISGADREGGFMGLQPPKEKQRKAAAQCKQARILRASAAAWYRRASFYVVIL